MSTIYDDSVPNLLPNSVKAGPSLWASSSFNLIQVQIIVPAPTGLTNRYLFRVLKRKMKAKNYLKW